MDMELKFRVGARIARPVAEVFEAVVNPDTLSRYFTTGGAQGRMETGAVVQWSFHDFPGSFPVHIVEVIENERIVFDWDADEPDAPYKTRVTIVSRHWKMGARWYPFARKAGGRRRKA